MSGKLNLWSDVECNSGTWQSRITDVVSARMVRRLDGRNSLVVATNRDAGWLTSIAPRQVVRVDTEGGDTLEWRVASVVDGRGEDPVTVVSCNPLHYDLRDIGFIADTTSGASTFQNLGLVAATPQHFFDTFIEPLVSGNGKDWINVGTVDLTDLYSISFERWTPLQLTEELVARTGLEFDLRRNGSTDYKWDLISAIGSSAAEVRVSPGRNNLLRVRRSRLFHELFTVVVPKGAQSPDALERGGIEYASWHVTNVSGNDLTLADRNGGDGPILEDDQLNNLYLFEEDGSLTQVTDSDATNQTVTAAGHSSSVGDEIMVVADSSGTLLTELTSPSGITAAGGGDLGRVVGTFELGDQRSERNWVKNPFASTWASRPTIAYMESDGAHSVSSTTVACKNGPAFYAPTDDNVVLFMEGSSQLATALTADKPLFDGSGSGDIDITASPALSDGDVILVWHVINLEPDGWARVSPTDNNNGDLIHYRDTTASDDAALVNGAVTSAFKVNIDGEPAGYVAPTVGDWLVHSGTDYPIIGTPSGSSTELYLGAALTASDDDNVTIKRPTLGGSTFGQAVVLASRPATVSEIDTPSITVRYVSDNTTLWASVAYTLHSIAGHTVQASAVPNPVKIAIRDASSELASVTDEDRTLSANESVDVTLRTSYTLTTDTDVRVRISGVDRTTGATNVGIDGDPSVHVRWVTLHLGEHESIPPIEGSAGTKLWQQGNLALGKHSSWPTTYEVEVRELVERWNLSPAEAQLTLGGNIRLIVPDMSINEVLRVVQIDQDIINPENTRITLSTALPRGSRKIRAGTAEQMFIDLEVTTDADGNARKTIVADRKPPTAVPGARRGVNDFTSTSGALTLKTFEEAQ